MRKNNQIKTAQEDMKYFYLYSSLASRLLNAIWISAEVFIHLNCKDKKTNSFNIMQRHSEIMTFTDLQLFGC